MYLNLVLGNQDGFRNLTTQIQNLTSDVDLYREEIINKIEVGFYLKCIHITILSINMYIFNFILGYRTFDQSFAYYFAKSFFEPFRYFYL